MGQKWTDEMQTNLERWQASEDVSHTVEPAPIDAEPFVFRDILRGLAMYFVAAVRHRVFRGAPPVWSLAEQCDFARWRRRVGEPNTPEIEEWLEGDLDIFEDLECFNA